MIDLPGPVVTILVIVLVLVVVGTIVVAVMPSKGEPPAPPTDGSTADGER